MINKLSKIGPSTPSYIFGYWRPWKENSNAFDSYLEYAKDVSLSKYGADIVGEYINQASADQVNAINNLGQQIGLGINKISSQLDGISEELSFLNQNTEILIEQQKLANILLHNISELLRVPDSEKERQHAIELGVKFFVNAQKDVDLLDDALEELLRAESLMKQDYFVLHRLGVIYLHSTKHINVEKSLEYFTKAAKYASVESDPKAMRLVNVLSNNINDLNKIDSKLKDTNITIKGIDDLPKETKREVAQIIEGRVESLSLKETLEIVNSAKNPIIKGITLKEAKAIDQTFQEVFLNLKVIISKTEKRPNQINSITEDDDISQIQQLAAESYTKAAFSAYVLGQFELAVNHQSKAVKFVNSAENYLMLAKYQTRTKDINSCVSNLEKSIDLKPFMVIAVFREIDLMNEPSVLKLIETKNKIIDGKINSLIRVYENIKSEKSKNIINKLKILQDVRYDIKINELIKYTALENEYDSEIKKIKFNIEELIKLIEISEYSIPKKEVEKSIQLLAKFKNSSLEEMKSALKIGKKMHDENILKIGVDFAGGIVFYIDKTGKHGLVVAKKKLGPAIWGNSILLGTKTNIGSGRENTMLILEKASWIKKGFFISKKQPLNTAARLCSELNLHGYNDWYLPSKDELNKIYSIAHKIKAFEHLPFCWSSSEDNEEKAWRQNMSGSVRFGGDQDTSNKMNTLYPHNFCAIRSF